MDHSLEELRKRFKSGNDEPVERQKSQVIVGALSQNIRDNLGKLLSLVTTLYVSNLSSDINSRDIYRAFSQYGEIHSVKLMWRPQ
jgi:RNA recognition motif-containing protein